MLISPPRIPRRISWQMIPNGVAGPGRGLFKSFLIRIVASRSSFVAISNRNHLFYHFRTTICMQGYDHMCIAIPAEVIEKKEGNIGIVDYGDLRQEVRLDLVDVEVGEFVLVHVGFAIQKLSREEGFETREIFRQVFAAMEEEAEGQQTS